MQVASTPGPANRPSPALTMLVPPGFSSISVALRAGRQAFCKARLVGARSSKPLSPLEPLFGPVLAPGNPISASCALWMCMQRPTVTSRLPDHHLPPTSSPRPPDLLTYTDSCIHKALPHSRILLAFLSSFFSSSTRLIVPVHSLSVLYTILHEHPYGIT